MNAKTRERIHRITFRVKPYVSESQLAALKEIVEYELREQNADTRHACAEAVSGVNRQYDAFQGGDHACQIVNRAHDACINVQAI